MKPVKLTKKENDAFKNAVVCKRACEAIIARVVAHFEKNELLHDALWDAVIEKYKLDKSKTYALDHRTHEVREEPKHSSFTEKLQDRVEILEFAKEVVKEKKKS